jgi:hypothetical protein
MAATDTGSRPQQELAAPEPKPISIRKLDRLETTRRTGPEDG